MRAAVLCAPQGQQLFVQFITRYQHWSGALRMRVTTLTRFWTDGATGGADLITCFDQEAAAVVMSRLATHKVRAPGKPGMSTL